MTLIGEHCHRWLLNHEDILAEVKLKLVEGLSIHIEGVEEKTEEEKTILTDKIDI